MKISNLKLHSIAIADPPLRSSYGLHAPWALRTIVEIETDDGVRGVSETYGGDAPRVALEAARESVIGRDPFQLAGLYQQICEKSAAERNVPGGRSQTWLVPGESAVMLIEWIFARHQPSL